jgi:hypothetical protein
MLIKLRIKNFRNRELEKGLFYITEKESLTLCKENDIRQCFNPILPSGGWERKIRYKNNMYWLGKRKINNVLVWSLKLIN